ncbi:hypothetical protein [Undibacterium sp. TS12]|uniref:hypothetical protein n=1 Tax=Undibacterium sp. TS12 TaxID=2908202 RepID=UPI001F4C6B2A|nr:hypothetical protein [Undibacterium sp. TS12]MCH8622564.1 hypothetical protein [Undibacterium sp. TS12]
MRLNILGDFDWESKIDQVLKAFSDDNYHAYFQERDYGIGLIGITIVLMCQDPALNLKRRIRLSKKEKKLYVDIMLDLPEMKSVDFIKKKMIISELLLKEIPEVISKYKIDDFDLQQFVEDFQEKFRITSPES